jgi:hypothetical protein
METIRSGTLEGFGGAGVKAAHITRHTGNRIHAKKYLLLLCIIVR